VIPLVDMHCHLVAGADDGPPTLDDAVEMCRIALAEGVGALHGLAHQNEFYPAVTPDLIRAGIRTLSARLQEEKIPVIVYPGAEVMVFPGLEDAWQRGELLSIADRLFVEMPHGLCLDLRDLVYQLSQLGVRTILAHPEQAPELLFADGPLEELIELGCLTAVSSGNVAGAQGAPAGRRLRAWFRRGMVHFLGSDGHSPRRRPPHLADAFKIIVNWVGEAAANRIGALNGLAVLQGLPLKTPPVQARRPLYWLTRFWART
jgi:protein-tyrosine phosphatase